MEDIVIIGTGNTATVLGRKLQRAGHSIVQVAGRTPAQVASLAAELGASPCHHPRDVRPDASFYLLAVSDNALPGIQAQWSLPNRLTAHTAGAVSIDVLKGMADAYGVFYPLQSLRKEVPQIPDIPLLTDGNSDASKEKLRAIAQSISPWVDTANDAQRMQLHLAAVLVNNFTNHLYALAENFCNHHGLSFHYLLPLIKETAGRLEAYSPQQVQTGPAIRNDSGTIRRHLALLENDAPLKEVYEVMTKSIAGFYST